MENVISIEDLGFRYGLGVFETLLVQKGKILFPDWHLESLRAASVALKLPQPDASQLVLKTTETGIWRWFHTPGGTYQFFKEKLPPVKEEYRLNISPLRLSSQSWEARYKTLSYLLRYQAQTESGEDETVLLNERGEVTGAAMANLFWIEGGIVFTPELDCGCRAGITRRWVIESGKIPLKQIATGIERLLSAEEVFISNSRIGIRPVLKIGGRKFDLGPKTRELMERYSTYLSQIGA